MNRYLFHSVRLIIPLLVTAAVIPSLLALLYSGFDAQRTAFREAEDETLQIVQNMAAIQERITASTKSTLAVLSMLPAVTGLDLPACTELFKGIIKNNSVYTNLLMVDRSGNIIASAVPHPPINIADRKHFRDAVESKKFSTGEYIISRTTAEPAFPFSYPVLNEIGKVQAVLIAAVKLREYAQYFQEESLTEGASFGITDHAGLRLFRIPEGGAQFERGKPISPAVWEFVQANEKKRSRGSGRL